VEEVSLPNIQSAPVAELYVLCPEASSYHDRYLPQHEGEYTQDVLAYIKMGSLMLGVQHVKAQRYRRLLRSAFEAAFRNVDAIVTPTLPVTAPRAGEINVLVDGQELQVTRCLTRNMVPFNLTGLPAVTVPCGFDSKGLPIGLQIGGRAFEESTILRLAQAYESAADWSNTPPI
jgi:aspartyl-tRNA(Asn)/glutamyl-tRNA(Gln) amidotransferase subunit A